MRSTIVTGPLRRRVALAPTFTSAALSGRIDQHRSPAQSAAQPSERLRRDVHTGGDLQRDRLREGSPAACDERAHLPVRRRASSCRTRSLSQSVWLAAARLRQSTARSRSWPAGRSRHPSPRSPAACPLSAGPSRSRSSLEIASTIAIAHACAARTRRCARGCAVSPCATTL